MQEEMMTFSQLRKVQKKEKKQEELAELGQNFMLNVADYFETKKETEGETREYRNAERVFEKIISLREDKIIRSAKIAANSGGQTPENLLPFENELFRKLKTAFSEHRDLAEKRKADSDSDIEVTEDPEPVEGQEDQSGDNSEDGYVKVKILSEVPEFMGTDLESYGPFEEGEEVKIPDDNAEILVNRGNAEELE